MAGTPVEPSAAAAPRRRWPWVLAAALAAVLLVVLTGAGWYVSGLLGDQMVSEHVPAQENLTVAAVRADRVDYRRDADAGGWADRGLMAIATQDGGWIQTGGPIADGVESRRIVQQQAGPPLAPGQRGHFEGNFYYDNPGSGLGLEYRDITIATPLGPAPAWFVPGDRDTWVIFVHGRNGDRREGLRALRTAAAQGYPALLITYRNDEGAPADDALLRFGYTEWRDLEAAAQYALEQGAQRLFLVGNSLGGGICLSFLANSPLAEDVAGMFLDSPIASMPQAISLAADDMGLPAPIVEWGKWIAERRFSIDYEAVDYTAQADRYSVPATVVAGALDDTVDPIIGSNFVEAVNAAHPGAAVYALFPAAEHTGAWNVDRPRYERLLRQALGRADDTALAGPAAVPAAP